MRRQRFLHALAVGALLASAFITAVWFGLDHVAGVATPPSNDNFASATAVGGLPFTDGPLSTAKATTETNEPTSFSCDFSGTVGATVWYDFTPSQQAVIQADTLGSDFDTVVSVYTGTSLSTLTLVACDDQSGGGGQVRLNFKATPGTTYHIQVGGFFGSTGNLVFNLSTAPAPPANDNFAAATVVGALPFSAGPLDTFKATTEPGEPLSLPCGGAFPSISNTVWYRFTPGADTVVTTNTAGSVYTTVLAVYTGATLSTLTNIECRVSFAIPAQIKFTARAGVTYYFQVGGYFGASGNLVFNLEVAPAPGAHDVANPAFTGPSESPGKTAQTYTARVRNNGSVQEDIMVGYLVIGPPSASVTMAAGTLPPGAVVEFGPFQFNATTLVMVIRVPLASGAEADVPISVTLPNGYGFATLGEETCHQGDAAEGGRGFSPLGTACLGTTDGSTDANPANDPSRTIAVTEITLSTPTPTPTPTITPTPKSSPTPKATPTANPTAIANGSLMSIDADCEKDGVQTRRTLLVPQPTFTVCVFGTFPDLSPPPEESASGYQVHLKWDEAVLDIIPRPAAANDVWTTTVLPGSCGPASGNTANFQSTGVGFIELQGKDTDNQNATCVYQGNVAEFEFSCESHGSTNLEMTGPGGLTYFLDKGVPNVKPSLTSAVVICLQPDFDSDRDGCTNQQEFGDDERLGGQRDPLNFWDFYDTPNAANVRDKQVDLFNDIFAVALRFGASGDPGGNPLTGPIPAAPTYHSAFDRGPPTDANGIITGAADGNIDLFNDIFGVAFQFSHSCQ